MALIIPNATDVNGSKFASLDQAEPDSLDFQMLGDRSTGVLSGCAVTALEGDLAKPRTVVIASGKIVVKGTLYTISSQNVDLPAAETSTTYRFDMVIARADVVAGTASIVIISGTSSNTNPTYPQTYDRVSGTPNSSNHINPDTDVVLAAVFRDSATSLSAKYVVDKRVNTSSTVIAKGASAPTNDFGVDGDFYYKTTVGSSSSGVYVKRDGAWVELLLQSDSGSVTPIGAIIMWPGNDTTPNPTGKTFWLECSGQDVSKTTYPALYTVLKTTYGAETSTTFKLPDLNNKFVKGSTTAGTSGGSNSVSLTTNNLPLHSHSLNSHTHGPGSHTHTLSVTKNITTASDGAHAHTGDSSGNGVTVRLGAQVDGGYVTGVNLNPNVAGRTAGYGAFGESDALQGMAVSYSSVTSTAGAHQHGVSVVLNDATSGPSASNTAGPSTTNTGDAGLATPTAVATVPENVTMRWFIRAL